MTAQPLILTVGLLEELEARWRAQQAPIARYLQPGISEEEMAELVEPLGMTIPSEVRTWYRWHNGAAETGRGIDREMCGTGWKFFLLQRAIEEALEQGARALEVCKGDEAEAERILWKSAWLPLADNHHGGVMFVEGRAQSDPSPTPVFYTEPQFGTQVPPPAPSLGQVVTWCGSRRWTPTCRSPGSAAMVTPKSRELGRQAVDAAGGSL